jgi:hypothetical protein
VASEADLTVLVIPRGIRAAALRRALDVLSQFGVKVSWGLLVQPRQSRWRLSAGDDGHDGSPALIGRASDERERQPSLN